MPAEAAPARAKLARSDATPGLQHADKLRRTDPHRQMTIGVNLALRNEAQLEALIAQVSDRKSPNYGRYLTPDQFATIYGPMQAQVQQVVDQLKASGLSIGSVSSNRTIVEATGPVSAVEAAFGVTISDWHDREQNRDFFGNDAEPTLPAAIASYVVGVAGLNNHYPLHRLGPAPSVAGAGPAGGYTPNELKKAYDVTPLASAGYTGSGQQLGLMELDGFRQSNITTYDTQYGLGSSAPSRVLVNGGPGPLGLGEIEVELDIELMHAIAPASPITVWEGPNSDPGVNATYNAIVTSNTTKSNSTSWGICEPNTSTAEMDSLHQIFQQAAAQGQSFFAASGDNGAYDCGDSQLTVDSPANDPYMTGTGGTNLALNTDGSYKMESAWSNPNTFAASGGGGGLSSYFVRPSWQIGPGVANSYSSGKRQVPDVSLDADPQTGYSVYVTYQGSTGWNIVGGTSAAAPAWAAFTGMYNQYAVANGNPNLGFANPTLYGTGSNAQAYAPYHDVTTGDNLYYAATTNWDYATGWGSFDAYNLTRDLQGSPSVTGINPASGSPAGGTVVSISGSNFSTAPGAVTVQFGSNSATSVSCRSATTCIGTSPPGTGTVHITVTTPGGTSARNSSDQFSYTGPCSSVTVAAAPASPEAVGTLITVTASAAGCNSPQYRFWFADPAGLWTVVQGFGSNATYAWNTAGRSPGTYRIWVEVHALGGTGTEASTETVFSIENGQSCSGLSIGVKPSSPRPMGAIVIFTASASGCATPQYRFWLHPTGGPWTVVQEYSSSASFSWNTTSVSPGTYTLWVDVHALGGATAEASASTLYSVESGPACSGLTLSSNPGSPQPAGTTVAFTASASGCTTPQYRFWLHPTGGPWTVVQEYSSSPSFNWNTTSVSPGTYTLWVDVHALGGFSAEASASTLYSVESGPACSGLTLSSNPGSPQPTGTTVAFTANASGCTTPQYRFWLHPAGGPWTVVQEYSGSASFSWNTTSVSPGTYTLWVDVHALGGYSAEASASQPYVLR